MEVLDELLQVEVVELDSQIVGSCSCGAGADNPWSQ